MGLLRKALFVSTGGMSGVVISANSKKERAAKAAEKQVRLQQQALKEQRARDKAAAVAPVLVADELAKLVELRQAGALTEEEFAAQKARLLTS
ncbi:MAG TPA: SHOCT domain-containing protein [Acidimicrobiales bacterium]|nr:SHOCT domain-containing protein [Acidimicrobiales bacterium]